MSETTIGSIVGFLRMDADQFHREIVKAITEVDALQGKRATVKLDVDTAGAERGFERVGRASRASVSSMDDATLASRRVADAAEKVRIAEVKLGEAQERRNSKASQILSAQRALTAAERAHQDAIFATYSANLNLVGSNDDVDLSLRKVERSSRETGKGLGILATSVIVLGPALVPVAAGAVGVGAAFGGMGVAGVAALIGIKSEMARGTATGLTYRREIDQTKTAMGGLASVAAKNVLGSFQSVVDDLIARTPTLTRQVGDLATMTGNAGANVAGGLLSGFIALNPLMRDAGVYVVDLTSRFNAAMSGQGVVAFGDYVRSVFPEVVETVEELVGAAGHLVEGFAPLGMGVLGQIRLLSELINAMPVEVLQGLATYAVPVFLGFRTWQALAPIVNGFGKALEGVGVSAERAATGMRIMNAATGIIGAALAVLSVIYTAHAESQRQAEQAANSYADALERSNGVIDEGVRLTALKLAQDAGLVDLGKSVGATTNDIVAAMLGEAGASERVTAAYEARLAVLKANNDGTKGSQQAIEGLKGRYAELTDGLNGQNNALDTGKQKLAEKNEVLKASTAATSKEAVAAQNLAAMYGASVGTYSAVVEGQKKTADAAATATIKMQLENDAAGLLKQSLDALNGKALSAAEAQNAFESSLVNMGDHTDKTGKKIKFTTTSITNMSAASVALRGQLNGQVANLQRVVEANGGLSGSTGKAREQMVKMRQQIIDNAVAHGVDRAAVTAYIDKLLKVPNKVPPTKLDVDKAVAQTKAKEFIGVINGIPTWRTVTLSVGATFSAAAHQAMSAMGAGVANIGASLFKKNAKADGGTVVGEGGPRDDKVMTFLSPGEEVIKNGPAQKHRALLKAINAEKFADGGTVGGVRYGGGYATGGTVAPLGQFWSDYTASLGDSVSKSDLVARRNAVANATKRLAIAEQKLREDRKAHRSSRTIAADELAIAKARQSLASATAAASSAQARYNGQHQQPLAMFKKANAVGIKNVGAFIANLQKLSKRGFVTLAQQLAAMGNDEAEKIAAQAAGAATSTLQGLTNQVNTAATQQKKLDHIDAITTILGTVRNKNVSARELAASSGIDVMELLDALALIQGDLKGNKNASKLLADLGKRSSGKLFAGGGKLSGPGTGTSDSILAFLRESGEPVRLSTNEYVSTADSTARNEAALEAGNRGATLAVAGASEPIDYERLTQMLVAAFSRVTLRPQIAAGMVDKGLGFGL